MNSGEPQDTFLDITPVLHDPFGSITRLNPVRYRIPKELAPLCGNGMRYATQGTNITGYPHSALSAFLQFELTVHWADSPSPEPMPTVESQQ